MTTISFLDVRDSLEFTRVECFVEECSPLSVISSRSYTLEDPVFAVARVDSGKGCP
ncbi:hypothetical protein [Natronobacterium lacisalsi]|uniref:hypothetical protein n=1 Tax=Natronobacterium lacisalsi TaxID=229731 RepID=UPI0012EC7A2E|nr:hypothetical protein [Halobiforma lacisalsi]